MTDFPAVVDSSLLASFKACEQKTHLGYFEHWKPARQSEHLVAGKAFASGLEAARVAFYRDGTPPAEAVAMGLGALWSEYGDFEPPDGSNKDALRMAGALEFYFERYPLGSDGAVPHLFGSKHGIEFSFAEPLSILHPQTGDPILFSGRADMVADAFGGVYGYDEKTTSQLGASWIKQWEHRSQFTAYCWGLRTHQLRMTGLVVRGVSILKNGFDTLQAITYRSDWEVDRWLAMTEAQVRRMILAWQTGQWLHNLDDACNTYGGCSFRTVCKSPEPEKWLPLYFHRRRWDPVTRTETDL